MRPTHLLETELLTRDRKFVEAQIHVFFSVDPRRADISYLADELQYKDDQWETIVKREMQSALFEVMRGFTSNELLTNVGLRDLREELSNNLSENLADLGIAVHPTHGVRIMRLLPHRKVMQAMIELEAADILGDAALCRMQPLLNAVGPVPAQGWQALLVTMASAIVNHEDPQKLEAAPKFAKTVGEVKDGNSPGGTPSPSRN